MKRYEIQKDDLEIEPDSIIDTQTNVLYECNSDDMNELCKILNKQDNKWQKLKEWLQEQSKILDKSYLCRQNGKTDIRLDKWYRGIIAKEILDKMQELEGEDVKD